MIALHMILIEFRDQLQSWDILTFDPQMTDIDEHIDLINTLGDMSGQTAET